MAGPWGGGAHRGRSQCPQLSFFIPEVRALRRLGRGSWDPPERDVQRDSGATWREDPSTDHVGLWVGAAWGREAVSPLLGTPGLHTWTPHPSFRGCEGAGGTHPAHGRSAHSSQQPPGQTSSCLAPRPPLSTLGVSQHSLPEGPREAPAPAPGCGERLALLWPRSQKGVMGSFSPCFRTHGQSSGQRPFSRHWKTTELLLLQRLGLGNVSRGRGWGPAGAEPGVQLRKGLGSSSPVHCRTPDPPPTP